MKMNQMQNRVQIMETIMTLIWMEKEKKEFKVKKGGILKRRKDRILANYLLGTNQ
jgi:hypothetical protein